MNFPKTIAELLDERISFCETWLKADTSLISPESTTEFIIAYENLKQMKKMLLEINNDQDPDGLIKINFASYAKRFVIQMVSMATDGFEGIESRILANDINNKKAFDNLTNIYKEIIELTGCSPWPEFKVQRTDTFKNN